MWTVLEVVAISISSQLRATMTAHHAMAATIHKHNNPRRQFTFFIFLTTGAISPTSPHTRPLYPDGNYLRARPPRLVGATEVEAEIP